MQMFLLQTNPFNKYIHYLLNLQLYIIALYFKSYSTYNELKKVKNLVFLISVFF